ncbi:unnamed protein product [Heligmosomoides polygyrus]|uniref:Peptidase M12A domain-containing protein n=1 Tax=Heligmosomoides polygyrus TaxID=6339 RepID=A0A3P8AAK9_HELPZ|nr:unnamed protein product [Heligmosomoides polygyrus]
MPVRGTRRRRKGFNEITSGSTRRISARHVSAKSRTRVFVEKGRWSYFGRIGKEQDLSLGRGCDTVGTATHELGHALGVLSHYVKTRPQFTKQTTKANKNYGIGYDFGSIMHYGSTRFVQLYSRLRTYTNYQETLGSRFSAFYDLLMLNTHYGCLCNVSAAVCENGGVPHPRNCRRCLCPNGCGAQLCNERQKSSCGATVQATSTYQDLHGRYTFCSHPRTQIEVRIDSIDGTYATDGCAYGGVEIETQEDQKSTGYRYWSFGFQHRSEYCS